MAPIRILPHATIDLLSSLERRYRHVPGDDGSPRSASGLAGIISGSVLGALFIGFVIWALWRGSRWSRQGKIRRGLLPPDPPKPKKYNFLDARPHAVAARRTAKEEKAERKAAEKDRKTAEREGIPLPNLATSQLFATDAVVYPSSMATRPDA